MSHDPKNSPPAKGEYPEEGRGLVPKLRFPEFRDTGEWDELELGPLTTKVGSGITPTGGDKNYKTEGRPFVRSQNVGWGELILNDVAFIDEKTHRSFDSTEIKVSDVLLNITGASIGRSTVADSRIAGGNVNQHVCIIRAKQDELNPALLNHFLISERSQKQIDSFQAGGNRQGLNFAQIRSFKIPLPPTENEQRRIADFLASLDELITLEAQKLDTLKTHKKGLMQQLFPAEGETLPKLRFPEFWEAGEWEPTTMGQIADFQSGGTPSKGNPAFWNGSIPWVSAKDMKHLFLSDTEDHITTTAVEDGARLVQAGTLLILTRGMTLLKDIPICIPSRQMSFNQDVKALLTKSDFDERFLAYLLLSSKQRLLSMVDVAGHGTGRLDTDELKAFKLMLPQKADERKRIADCLASLDDLITAQTQKLAALKTHKKGLMQQLFPALDEVQA